MEITCLILFTDVPPCLETFSDVVIAGSQHGLLLSKDSCVKHIYDFSPLTSKTETNFRNVSGSSRNMTN